MNCCSQSAYNFKIAFLIDRTTLWQEFMRHHVIVIEENSEQNLHILPNLSSFFGLRSSGRFHWNDWALDIHPWFVTSYDLLEEIWIVVERPQHFLSDVHAFSNFGTIFVAVRFMYKASVKIAWHEPTNMPTSSAILQIVIRQLSKFQQLLTCSGGQNERRQWHLLCLP